MRKEDLVMRMEWDPTVFTSAVFVRDRGTKRELVITADHPEVMRELIQAFRVLCKDMAARLNEAV